MPKFIKLYVHWVDKINAWVGRVALFLVFAIMAILLYSSISRYFLAKPVIWGVEMAQFTMVIYYTLGGGLALLLRSHVRMDLLYSRWGQRKQARMDTITFIFLMAYLGLLFYGCLSSTAYSLEYSQRNNTAWGPPIAPVKIIMAFGIFMTMLQAVSEFFKDMAKAKGINLGQPVPELRLIEENELEKLQRVSRPVSPPKPLAPVFPPERPLEGIPAYATTSVS
jgi:TRAP-type mannitol/chloroaromatic compound transport system permease small subunit